MRMSRVLLLLVALIAGGLAAFLATRGGDAPAPAPVGPDGPTVIEEAREQILVATAPIGVGERLSQANMAWADWPQNAVRADYIQQSAMPEALTDMRGTVQPDAVPFNTLGYSFWATVKHPVTVV